MVGFLQQETLKESFFGKTYRFLSVHCITDTAQKDFHADPGIIAGTVGGFYFNLKLFRQILQFPVTICRICPAAQIECVDCLMLKGQETRPLQFFIGKPDVKKSIVS